MFGQVNVDFNPSSSVISTEYTLVHVFSITYVYTSCIWCTVYIYMCVKCIILYNCFRFYTLYRMQEIICYVCCIIHQIWMFDYSVLCIFIIEYWKTHRIYVLCICIYLSLCYMLHLLCYLCYISDITYHLFLYGVLYIYARVLWFCTIHVM